MNKWASRAQRSGAVLLILCATAHMIGHVMNSGAKGSNDSEIRLLELMSGYRIPEVGRTMQELTDGFSLTFSVMFAALGLLAWSANLRALIIITIALLCESAIGLRYWFIAPNSFILTATLCFLVALLLRWKEERS